MNSFHLVRATGPDPPSRRILSSALLQALLAVQARLAAPAFAVACVGRLAAIAATTSAAADETTNHLVPLIASLAWLALEPARLACGYAGNLRESGSLLCCCSLLSAPQAAATAALLGSAARRLLATTAPGPSLRPQPPGGGAAAAHALFAVDAALSAVLLTAAVATVALCARASHRFARDRRRLLLRGLAEGRRRRRDEQY